MGMNKKKRRLLTIVSIVVTLTMVLQICPMSIFAFETVSDDGENAASNVSSSFESADEVSQNPLLEEDVSKRSEFSKHYTSSHTGVITGKLSGTDERDFSTLEFIVEIINGTQGDYTASELQSLFGITQNLN